MRAAAALLFLCAPATLVAQEILVEKPRTILLQAAPQPAGPPPSGVRATPGPTNVGLRWTCPTGATGYDVFATPTGGAQVKLTATPLPGPCVQDLEVAIRQDPRLPSLSSSPTYSSGYNHTGLTVRSEYTYVVRALYPTGVSDAAPITVQTTPWPAPTGVAATVSGRAGVITWNAISGVSSYLLFRKLASESAFQRIQLLSPSVTSYTDPTILPPGQHQYYLQATDGVAGAPVTLTVGPWPAPTGLAITEEYVNIVLRWEWVRGTNQYLVFRQLQGEPGFTQVTATPLNTNGYTNQPPPAQTHRYYVQAVGGDPSAIVSIMPGKPKNLSLEVSAGYPIVEFRWGGAYGATVSVQRSMSPQGPFAAVPAVFGTGTWQAQDRAATIGATQYYKLFFVYPTGVIESEVLTAAIGPAPKGITNLSATALGGGQVRLLWTCDPQATGYSFLRAKDKEPADWVRQPGSTYPVEVYGCTYTDGNLSAGSTYTYRVTAKYTDRNTSTNAVVSVVAQ